MATSKLNLRWDIINDVWGFSINEEFYPIGTEDEARTIAQGLIDQYEGEYAWA